MGDATDRLMPWHQPPDDPGFWETKRMPKKKYVVKLSVLVEVDAHNNAEAAGNATGILWRAICTQSDITDIETEEVTEV